MPIIKSAIKQMKQAEAARDRNREVKVKYRNKIKAVQKDLEKDGKNFATLTSDAFSAIDKAAKRGIIHKNAAARKKSKISLALTRSLGKQPVLKSMKVKATGAIDTKPSKPKKKTTKKIKK